MFDGDIRSDRPRLVPDKPFPPYSYVTGRFAHPQRDPLGHSFGVAPAPCPAPQPDQWRDCRHYLYGLDLFNHGFYWEAHEVWEAIWHACGRSGVTANFIKGLIKLAAAGVKVREGRLAGVATHTERAAALFDLVADALPAKQTCYFGLPLDELATLAHFLARDPATVRQLSGAPVEIVFDFVLSPKLSP